MNADTLEKWTWPLIFGGLLLVGLGVSVGQNSPDDEGAFGAWVIGIGLAAAAVGVLLIYLRSRIEK